MPIPLRFAVKQSADHETPSADTPAVLLWSPGSPQWTAPYGALTSAGNGVWSVTPDPRDQAGGSPLLLWATAADADPAIGAYYPDGAVYTAGATALPLVLWVGSAASDGYLPAPGLALATSLVLSCSSNGAAFAPAAGTLAEPGGVGNGNGYYLYTPAAAEVAAPGDLALFASGSGLGPATFDYILDPPPGAGVVDLTLALTDPDACTLVTPGGAAGAPSGQARTVVQPGADADLIVQCRFRGTGAPAVYAATDTLRAELWQAGGLASLGTIAAAWYSAAGNQTGYAQGQLVLPITPALPLTPTVSYVARAWRTTAAAKVEEIARVILSVERPA